MQIVSKAWNMSSSNFSEIKNKKNIKMPFAEAFISGILSIMDISKYLILIH